MGLLDIVNGMQNGPRGNRGLGGGGMSPITMALLGLLAYKAVKGFRSNPAQPGTASFIGQAVGWYRADQGAGFIAATVGAIVVLFTWNRIAASRAF
jgi:Transglycosylase associated protein